MVSLKYSPLRSFCPSQFRRLLISSPLLLLISCGALQTQLEPPEEQATPVIETASLTIEETDGLANIDTTVVAVEDKPAIEEKNNSSIETQSALPDTQVGGALFIDDTQAEAENLTLNESTTNDDNVWLRIKRGFAFPTRYPLAEAKNTDRVTHYLKRLEKSPHYFKGLANSARPYLYYVVSELEKNNIPLEIALLPIVESRYDPFAYSPSRAAGLWQFIPSTGKRFGLTQDWWQDERRDTIAATGAAIQYLLYLHDRFDNDWLIALAAYNAGQGNVAKAIRKNKKLGKPTDYWSLDLPRETRHYVPQLLAWREFIREADPSIIETGFVANKPYFDVVDVGTQIDLAEAAQLAQTDIDTLYQLNPTFNRWATDPQSPHYLLVPIDKKLIFEQALETIPDSQRITWQRYTVRSGDVLGKIAQQFSTSVAMIATSNNLQSNVVRIGQSLLIPSAKEKGEYYSKSVEQRLAKTQTRSPRKNSIKINHKVSQGETLWDIGKRYGVSTSAIARWNNMSAKDVLRINQTLVIRQKETTQLAKNDETRKLFYRVKSGDSLSTIANRFDVAINDIKNWNNDARAKYIKPGQLLTLYVALTNR